MIHTFFNENETLRVDLSIDGNQFVIRAQATKRGTTLDAEVEHHPHYTYAIHGNVVEKR